MTLLMPMPTASPQFSYIQTPESATITQEFSDSPPHLLQIPSGTAIPGDRNLKLKADIFVAVDRTKDGVLLISELLEEDGYGPTFGVARQDFLTSLRDRYDSLMKVETDLSPSDRKVLDGLRSSISFGS